MRQVGRGRHRPSQFCDNKVTNNVWSDGRVSFTFLSTRGDLLITFTGIGSAQVKPDPDTAIQPVDGLIISLDRRPSDVRAVGQCRYRNPYKRNAIVVCSADTAEGHYEGSFTSNGQPPRTIRPGDRGGR